MWMPRYKPLLFVFLPFVASSLILSFRYSLLLFLKCLLVLLLALFSLPSLISLWSYNMWPLINKLWTFIIKAWFLLSHLLIPYPLISWNFGIRPDILPKPCRCAHCHLSYMNLGAVEHFNLMLLKTSALFSLSSTLSGDHGSTVVKVLHYKSEGCWFDPRWCRGISHWHKSF
jgi:hypothetical protein